MVRPDGTLWPYGHVKPVEEYLKYLEELTPSPPNEDSASDESDNASLETHRGSQEDFVAGPIEGVDPVDHNNNVVLVNGPDPAEEADEESLGSSPDCSLE